MPSIFDISASEEEGKARQANLDRMMAPQAADKAATVISQSVQANPAQAEQHRVLADQFGTTPDVVAAYPDEFRQKAAAQVVAGKMQSTPALAAFINENPSRGEVMHTTLDNTGAIEQTAQRRLHDSRWSGVKPQDDGEFNLANTLIRVSNMLGGIVAPVVEGVERYAPIYGTRVANVADKAAYTGMAALGSVTALPVDAIRGDTEFGEWYNRSFVQPYATRIDRREAEAQTYTFGEKLASTAGDLTGMLGLIYASGAGGVSPLFADATVATPALSVANLLAHGAAAASPVALSDAVQTGRKVFEQTGDMKAAARAMEGQYASSTAMMLMPLSSPGALFKRIAQGFPLGILGGEVARSISNATMPDSMQAPLPSAEDMLLQGIVGSTFAIMGPRHDPVTHTQEILKGAYAQAGKIAEANAAHSALVNLSALATHAESLKGVSPEMFHQVIERIAESKGASEIYIDKPVLEKALADSGIPMEQWAAKLPDVIERLTGKDATESTPIKVSAADFLTHLAGEPFAKDLMENFRERPESITYAESKQFFEQQKDIMLEKAAAAVKGDLQRTEFQKSQKDVFNKLTLDLIRVKGHPADIARVAAAIPTAFMSSVAREKNITPTEAWERYGFELMNKLPPNQEAFGASKYAVGTHINIGLMVGDQAGGAIINHADVMKDIEAMGVDVKKFNIHYSKYPDATGAIVNEPGMYAELSRPLTAKEIDTLSVKYGQLAIPQLHEGAGTMYGPDAARYPYEHGYFKGADGVEVGQGNGPLTQMREGFGQPSDITLPLRDEVIKSQELTGDGRDFTDFFTSATLGQKRPMRDYEPLLKLPKEDLAFKKEMDKHLGEFDAHIATSIPGFREVQVAVGSALLRAYPKGANVLDIGASEGGFIKALTALSDGKIKTYGLDPNEAMARHFAEHSTVPGSTYQMEAFGTRLHEGLPAWVEPSGAQIKYFEPRALYDVVHEAMTFQFISRHRNAQFARVKELMKEKGIALFEEKITEQTAQHDANEAKKDAYKETYYTAEALEAKKQEVLLAGAEKVKAAEDASEQKKVGMKDFMPNSLEIEVALKNNFKHVAQYWDSGNFKGYIASDSLPALEKFLSELSDLNSDFSTVRTPIDVEAPGQPQLPSMQLTSQIKSFYRDLKRATKEKDIERIKAKIQKINYERQYLADKEYEDRMRRGTGFEQATRQQEADIQRNLAWKETGEENGLPTFGNEHVALKAPRDITDDFDITYMPLEGERAIHYDIHGADGKVVGEFVLELDKEGFPRSILDIGVKDEDKGKGYAEKAIAGAILDAGELRIWNILPSAKSFWEKLGVQPTDGFNGLLSASDYYAARASGGVKGALAHGYFQHGDESRVSATGVHFSRDARDSLDSSFYGKGAKGAERDRIPAGSPLENRIHYYINTGKGIKPEPGVGGQAHVADLHDLYDADSDWLKLFRNARGDANAAELAVMDAGFSGFLSRAQGVAVQLGPRVQPVVHAGGVENVQDAPIPRDATTPPAKQLALDIIKTPGLPAGEMTPKEWEREITAKNPLGEKLNEQGAVDRLPERKMYLDEFLRNAVWQDPWYYSGMGKALADAPAKIFGNGQSVKEWLLTTGNKVGAKKEEIEATGITDWLDTLPKGAATREAVAAFLKTGGIKLKDVVRGANDPQRREAERMKLAATDEYNAENDKLNHLGTFAHIPNKPGYEYVSGALLAAGERAAGRHYDPKDLEGFSDEWIAQAEKVAKALDKMYEAGQEVKRLGASDVKFGSPDWKLPGGRDYAEKLVLLDIPPVEKFYVEGAYPDVFDTLEAAQAYAEEVRTRAKEYEGGTVNQQIYASSVRLSPPNIRKEAARDHEGQFTGGHYPEPNIIGHTRVQTFDVVGGGRNYHVDEFQSDWGEKGRKEGFLPTEAEKAVMQKEYDKLKARWAELKTGPYETDAARTEATKEQEAIRLRLEDLHMLLEGDNRTPRGPFVGKTESWVALLLKRSIVEAIDSGHDTVTWTTGEQQADRYSLAKVADEIRATKNSDGTYWFIATQDRGERRGTHDIVMEKDQLTYEQLVEHIGKDLADRIALQDKRDEQAYTGLALKVGGEGMRKFYDEIVPQVARKVLRSIGGEGVEEIRLIGGEGEKEYRVINGDGALMGTYRARWKAEQRAEAFGWTVREVQPTFSQPGFRITPAMREAVANGLPLFQNLESARGAYLPSSRSLALLKDANLSTYLHETGHWALDIYTRIANGADAPPRIADDVGKIFKWLGVESMEKWGKMTMDEQRPFHEQFARGFERYLMEGKAPAPELSGAFNRIRAWMKDVYKTISNLGVELSPEVRGVFDRMLASDEAIKAAQDARSFAMPFKTEAEAVAAGFSVQDYQAWATAMDDATQAAMGEMNDKSLKDMKWLSGAKNRAMKAAAREAQKVRAGVEAEITKQVEKEPVYRAEDFLSKGKLEFEHPTNAQRRLMDDYAGQPAKLDKAALVEMFGDKSILLSHLKNSMVTSKGGYHPDVLADILGFGSGEEMVKALVGADPRETVIQALTDRKMIEDHGDMTSMAAVDQAANEALHNTAMARFLATGLKVLSKSPIPVREMARAAKEAAEAAMGQKRVGEVDPKAYLAAETRANQQAIKLAAKKPTEAVAAQREALVNNQLARAAMDAKALESKALIYFKRFAKQSTRDRLPGSFVEQIDALLAQFDFRQNPAGGDKRVESLMTWADALYKNGYEPQVAEWLQEFPTPKHYKELTVEQFRGLFDTIRSIEATARQYREVTRNGKKVALREVIDEMKAVMDARGESFTSKEIIEPPTIEVDGFWKTATHWLGVKLRSVTSNLDLADYRVNRYDMQKIDGIFHEMLLEPIVNANYRKVDMLRAHSLANAKVAESLGRDWQKSFYDLIENTTLVDNRLDGSPMMQITRGRLLGIMRHIGNESNFEKLYKGYGWKPEDVMDFVMKNATAKDWEATQAHWAIFDPLWKETEAMVRRIGGVPPPKIPAREFDTPHGKVTGGYSPIDYDPRASKLSKRKGEFDLEANENIGEHDRALYRATTTSNSSLIARKQGYTDFVNLDIHSAEARIRDTIHDIAYREALLDAKKIVNDKEFRDKFLRTYGREEYAALVEWYDHIRDSYLVDGTDRGFGRALTWAKQGIVAVAIGYRVSTVIKHGGSAGLKSLGYLGTGEGAKYFASHVLRMGSGHLQEEIALAQEKFPEIRARMLQMDRDYKVGTRAMYDPETLNQKNDRFGHAMVAWSDALSAIPTAWAAYDLAITSGVPKSMGGSGVPMTEAAAVNYANSIVRQAHGSALESARSNFMNTHSPAKQLFGVIYGFMNNTFGQTRDMMQKAFAKGEFNNNPALVARAFAALIIPAMLAHWVSHGAPAEDESGAEYAAKAILYEMMGTVPFVRDIGTVMQYKGMDSAVAPIRVLHDISKVGTETKKFLEGEDNRVISAWLTAIGEVGHISGLGQLGKTLEYLTDYGKGIENPESLMQFFHDATLGPKHHN